MAAINHFYIVLVLSFTVHFIDTYPLCGTMDGSPQPTEADKIYFKGNHGIRTVEINGTVVACYPDGTLINNTSTATEINEPEQTSATGNPLKYAKTQLFWINFVFFFRIFLAERRGSNSSSNTKRATPPIDSRFSPTGRSCTTQNQTYCTSLDNYPLDHIEKLMRKNAHKYADVFGSDVLVADLGVRIDNPEYEEELCDSREEVIYPTEG